MSYMFSCETSAVRDTPWCLHRPVYRCCRENTVAGCFYLLGIQLGDTVQMKRFQAGRLVDSQCFHECGIEKRARLIHRRNHHSKDRRRSQSGGDQGFSHPAKPISGNLARFDPSPHVGHKVHACFRSRAGCAVCPKQLVEPGVAFTWISTVHELFRNDTPSAACFFVFVNQCFRS